MKKIVEQSDLNKSTIYRILKRNNTIPNRNLIIKLTEDEIGEILTMYNSSSNMSAVKIGRNFNISNDSIIKILKENGISVRKQPRKHIINEEFFDTLNPNALYVVGLIQTDGTIHKDLLGFSIIQKDIDLLKKIAIEMGANEDIIYTYKSAPVPVLIVRSEKMVRSLMNNFKLHPNKTKTLEMPLIPNKFKPSMMRGIFDGDGHFSKREAGVVTASESFALSFYEMLQDYQLNPILNIEKPKETWLFRIYVRGKDNLKSLNRILHSDKSPLFRMDKKQKLENAYRKDDKDE